ncbi:hypothetical protein [Laspinema olomoucense]|uniref:Uncharacterized protein n=1 Tax=Laspinema olomoucense D3b TaxID=2953688 RepID=A0ABT2NFY9_9CYAN|nr:MULTISPECIES: hypothetical protein [unclassified Laspinema]MCT7975958.1 hypothetical protein [Laspinema sp. D3d]MCT7981611.1 hypothetical protein [Laspinema sp. D3b]MCT7988579.1 hypothetical protein [Laspinema sp. D3a]MCT7993891.1 hypothetical protein [Laspinema sp. D3c]
MRRHQFSTLQPLRSHLEQSALFSSLSSLAAKFPAVTSAVVIPSLLSFCRVQRDGAETGMTGRSPQTTV